MDRHIGLFIVALQFQTSVCKSNRRRSTVADMASGSAQTVGELSTRKLIGDKGLGLSTDEILVRLIHFWEARNPAKGGMLIGIELLLIDSKGTVIQSFIAPHHVARYECRLKLNVIFLPSDGEGNVIQAFIAPNRLARYESRLKRNSVYKLTHFYATPNKEFYRVSEHKYTLYFTDLTTFVEEPYETSSIQVQRFQFRTVEQFEALSDRRGDLCDVIGHLKMAFLLDEYRLQRKSFQEHPSTS